MKSKSSKRIYWRLASVIETALHCTRSNFPTSSWWWWWWLLWWSWWWLWLWRLWCSWRCSWHLILVISSPIKIFKIFLHTQCMGQFGGHFIRVAQYQWCATQFDNIAFGTTSQAGHFITTAPRCETFHRHRHNVDHFIIAGIQQIIIWDEFRFTESETKFATYHLCV